MNDIFKLMSEKIEKRLLQDLSKDFPDMNKKDIEYFIYKKQEEILINLI